jgi:translocation and assembly module TamB
MERRRRVWPRAVLALLLFVLLVLLVVWTQRVGIAEDYIERELRRRGVEASYDVTNIGFRRQRLENVVLGDPADPDLVAHTVEVEILIGFHRPRVGLITARGVRLRGRVMDGTVSFGEVDKLLPPPTDEPFRLPDQRIDLADAGLLLETPGGAVGIGINGKGNLSDGFSGHVAALSQGLDLGACRIAAPRALLAVRVADGRPTLRGPLRAESGGCGETLDIVEPHLGLDLTLARGFDAWRGSADSRAAAVRAGPQALGGVTARLSFAGNARQTAGDLRLGAVSAATNDFRAGGTRLAGRYAFAPQRGEIAFVGDAALTGLVARQGAIGPLARELRALGGTPIEPIGDALADAVEAAATRGTEARANVRFVNAPTYGAVRFERLRAESRSGARLAIDGPTGLTYYWPDFALRIDGEVALAGGGFPNARLRITQARGGGGVRGTARVAPMAVGDARLALSDIAFSADREGTTRMETFATMSGPFGGSRVEGLALPLQARFGGGAFALNENCVDTQFQRLRVNGLDLAAARLPLCPTGRALVWRVPGGRAQGGGRIAAPRFAGTLAGTPITIAGDWLRFDIAGPTLDASAVAVGIGRAPWINRLTASTFTADFSTPGGGVAGRYTGLAGQIAGVPLLFSEGQGTWLLRSGELLVAGRQQVADEADPPRFYPLVSNDFRLTLVDNIIRSTASLRHPGTGTLVTEASVRHNLGNGRGGAVLDVPGITFGEALQPDDLTPLTLGVVALVDGTVTGQGRIDWTSDATTSTGRFATEGMNLAAAFGPVENLTTEVNFSDLLGMVSAPGQIATVGVVRTGIDVFDGLIRYQLLADNRVRIEGGRWPFAGGELLLEETVLDFGQPSTHRLTFRIIGMEAENFIAAMEFANISATGTFDGVIPMEFDISGGRVVGGRLEARPAGGTISYIGELTDQDLGTWGKLAFDALKSLRYSRLIINLDGSLDGEFLTRIQFDGIARDPELAAPAGGGIAGIVARRALGQLARIPFRFNIRAQGPFRALIGTTRSFEDPSLLIQPVLPTQLRGLPTEVTNVQRDESENEP